GTVVLSLPAASSFDGQLSVSGGTLKAGNANFGALTANASFTSISTGAVLDLNGFSATINNLTGSGTLASGANAGQATTINKGTFDGAIIGLGAVTKETAGTLTLTGNNSYSGITTVNGGTLQIGSGGTSGTLGNGGNVVMANNSILVFNRSDVVTVGNQI